MFGSSKKPAGFTIKAIWIALIVAALIAVASWWAVPRPGSVSATARAGDVKRGPDGRLLYFDGRQWTHKPLPPQDLSF
jgi:hypothetical protein